MLDLLVIRDEESNSDHKDKLKHDLKVPQKGVQSKLWPHCAFLSIFGLPVVSLTPSVAIHWLLPVFGMCLWSRVV